MAYSASTAAAYEDAIVAWAIAASGLGSQNVRWDDGTPRPDGTYLSLGLPTFEPIGDDWKAYDRAVGGEIIERVRGLRRMTLQLTCIAATPTGAGHARAVLADLVAASAFDHVGELLRAANIGLLGFEPIRVIAPTQNLVVFEPRAIVVVAFSIAAELSYTHATGGAIEHVEVTPTIDTVAQPMLTIDKAP